MNYEKMLDVLKQSMAPALGCTEPMAIAYAVALAKSELGSVPEKITVRLSRNVLKNARGVGIPKTGMVGVEIAAAMGATGGDPQAKLEVLHSVSGEEMEAAEALAGHVQVELAHTDKKLYIEVLLADKGDEVCVIIEDSHTNVVEIRHGERIVFGRKDRARAENGDGGHDMTIRDIVDCIRSVGVERLSFLEPCIRLNGAVAKAGMEGDYGLHVGRDILGEAELNHENSVQNIAVSMTAAAADLRMAGGTLPVMTVCGSGNQGLTATVPVIAYAQEKGLDAGTLYRALALSCLVTIHVKYYIGKLSALCGCGVGSSIGVSCALVYMQGGSTGQIEDAVQNMIATVSGMICDGAKAGCALKIAAVVASAFQSAALAMNHHGAGRMDGITGENVEKSIQNLGKLGRNGMEEADRVILDLMLCN